MEYFAKFTRHIGAPKKPPARGATQLAKFEKAWKTVQGTSYYQEKWRGIAVEKTLLPGQLEAMFDLLVQEDIQQADTDDLTTGACMEYLLGNGVLDELVRLAESDQPAGVRGLVISNIATFISLADDKLLVQKAVHNPVLELLRWYSSAEAGSGQREYDGDFVALLYALCSKIRGDPALLNIFFQDRKWLKSVEQRSFSSESIAAMVRSADSLRSTDSGFEFLLFSHLLRFVHRDGEVGDTARTSLLFLLELATTEIMASTGGSTALELFILDDSGFAAILSATLGAMYSQLPRSLHVSSGPAAVVPESFPSYTADLQNAIESSIFSAAAAERAERWSDGRGPVSSTSPEFRACLASFANLLAFIQDVLYRCPSPYVCSQLLANLRSNFLRAILYPSLLESSDTDGSSVAVMRYLETMLQTARHEDLVSAIMDFLTDEGASAKRAAEPACLPFTLRDLIHTNLQSSVSIDAVVSALNLLRLILTRHCRYSPRLIEVERVQSTSAAGDWMTSCTVAIDVHRQELDMYARLMAQLQGDGGGGERRAAGDVPALHIPWRHSTPTTPLNNQPRPEARTPMPESFTAGYDAYLEDAALDWDGHCAYHAELDALFAAQAARDASLCDSPPPPTGTGAAGAAGWGAVGQGKQRRPRPRKYSEAVAVSADVPPPARSAPAVPQPRAREHARYNVKPSDPTVRVLMNLLAKYFAQPRECNLALTGVLAALIGCPHRTLDLWLGFSLPTLLDGVLSKPWAAWMDNLRNISDDERAADTSDSEGEDITSSRRPGGAPAMALAAADASKYVGLDRELQDAIRALPSGATPPSLFLVISGLAQQAAVLRNEIPDFGRRLRRARNALMGVVEDTDVLDEELEVSSNHRDSAARTTDRNRDRGLSSASLESARGAPPASPGGPRPAAAAAEAGLRSRSASLSAGRQPHGRGQQQQQPAKQPPKDAQDRPSTSGARSRSNSAAHPSEAASAASASTGSNAKPVGDGAAWHALSTPPANASLPEFIENVIILQESIKEIIARVQVRRENGGDESAIV